MRSANLKAVSSGSTETTHVVGAYRALNTLLLSNTVVLILLYLALGSDFMFEHGLKVLFFTSATCMFLYERCYAERAWPLVADWWWRSLGFTAVQASVVYYSGPLWDDWLLEKRAWNVAELGVFLATVLAFLVLTFVSYWQHRIKHMVPCLWRYLHQVHHSPERLELLTSYYRNPLEIFLNMFVISLVLYLIVGSTPRIATDAVLLLGLTDMFYHWNVRTPRWLGYFIQRPESHCIHHCVGVHAFNYGDIALWDMLFGTFRNPARFTGKCGFGNSRERRVFEMISGNDMSLGQHLYGSAEKNTEAHAQ